MTFGKTDSIYQHIAAAANRETSIIDRLSIGLTWTTCRTITNGNQQLGLAMSP